jgi:VIT1/CCC1 family predicted Fe2+/Mn2+ transporter
MEDLLTGVVLIAVGILILYGWQWSVQSAINSGDVFCEFFHIPQMSEKFRRVSSEIIAKLVGISFVLGGFIQLIAFFTGRSFLK